MILPPINTAQPSYASLDSYSSRRKRTGWWDKTTNKDLDISKVKQMLRKSGTFDSSMIMDRNSESKSRTNYSKMASLGNLDVRGKGKELLPIIDLDIMSGSMERLNTVIKNSSDYVTMAAAAEESPKPIQRPKLIKPKPIQQNLKKRVPWNYDVVEEKLELPVKSTLQIPSSPMSTKSRQTPPSPVAMKSLPLSPITKHLRPHTTPKDYRAQITNPTSHSSPKNPETISNQIMEVSQNHLTSQFPTPISLYTYLISQNYYETAKQLCIETNLQDDRLNHIQLFHFLSSKEYARAVVLVQKVFSKGVDADLVPCTS